MPLFRVVLRGHLPQAAAGAERQPAGFVVTRWVTAPTQTAAVESAVSLVRGEAKYHQLSLVHGRPPELTVDQVDEGEPARAAQSNRSGYVFFDSD